MQRNVGNNKCINTADNIVSRFLSASSLPTSFKQKKNYFFLKISVLANFWGERTCTSGMMELYRERRAIDFLLYITRWISFGILRVCVK